MKKSMMKRMMLLALCAALVWVMIGCTKVTEERSMPGAEAGAAATDAAQATAVPTAEPTDAPAEVPEGEKGPDEPGING